MPVSADSSQALAQPRLTADDVERALRARGGTATRAVLTRALRGPTWTVARRLDDLIKAGRVERFERGLYRLVGEDPADALSGSAAEIVHALRRSGSDAHLTGFDPVAANSHQFVRSFPHLVYADPEALEQVSSALAQAGFQPVRAGRAARDMLMHAPDPDRIVVMRGQPIARMDRLGVRSEIAPVEKAWLDLLREARGGSLPISLNDAGAILASLLRSSADETQLTNWAREMGYEHHVQAVLDPRSSARDRDAETRQLADGALR